MLISGSQRKTCVALTRLSPEEYAFACKKKHSFCEIKLAFGLLCHPSSGTYARVIHLQNRSQHAHFDAKAKLMRQVSGANRPAARKMSLAA